MSAKAMENEKIAEKVEQIHMENPDKGYRRINDDLRHNELELSRKVEL